MSKPEITWEDIESVLANSTFNPERWMEQEGMPFELINILVGRAINNLMKRARKNDGALDYQNTSEVIANVLMIGWELGRELGRRGQET